jgi:proline-specific peptidase
MPMTGDFRFDGRRVWYSVVGELDAGTPLVCVPGGPGMPHDYLEPLGALATQGRAVVFYDALGSGRSERLTTRGWHVDLYADELEALLQALGLERYHLFAHSAAGLAAYPHALRRPPGLVGLVLSSCPASIAAHHAGIRPLLGLSPVELDRFERAERNWLPRDLTYMNIAERYGRNHICRVSPQPDAFVRGLRGINRQAHAALKGGLCFYTTGLATWDVTSRLGEIAARTLVVCGRDDCMPPEAYRAIEQQIPRAELAIFEHSTHMPHLEEPERLVERVASFLAACD